MSGPNISYLRQKLLHGRETAFSDEELAAMYEVDISGQDLYCKLSMEIKLDNRHKFITINVQNGDYVIGDTELESMQLFYDKYGKSPSWGTQIDV